MNNKRSFNSIQNFMKWKKTKKKKNKTKQKWMSFHLNCLPNAVVRALQNQNEPTVFEASGAAWSQKTFQTPKLESIILIVEITWEGHLFLQNHSHLRLWGRAQIKRWQNVAHTQINYGWKFSFKRKALIAICSIHFAQLHKKDFHLWSLSYHLLEALCPENTRCNSAFSEKKSVQVLLLFA